MEVKLRYIGDYVAYACPRCLNGTMYWQQDKSGTLPYLTCILCGEEVRQREKFEKTGKNVPKGQEFEAKPEKIGKNKRNKKGIKTVKWQFNRS